MIKNLSPIMTGDILRGIDLMEPGDLLEVVSGDYRRERVFAPILDVSEIGLEMVVDAIFAVLPLPHDDPSPLFCWLDDDPDEASTDIAFAVNGLACDAESRRVGMTSLVADQFDALAATAVAAISAESTLANCAFLIRKGVC